ncbi:LysR family transcriptional regulator [Xanthomonas arboricola]|uniref:LysR family transcriptional regulator n=1 Tax=Xanthomonas arboricola TaxID=56448 RepID=UPI001CC59BF5
MLTLRQLEFAVAVAEEGGFTAAARRCNTVQSALSHQVAKIEESLGARLFERGTRQVRPTAAGEVFLHNARATLRAAERLHEEMAQALGTVRGRLTLGQISSLTTVQLPTLLRAFRSAHARVDVHLRTAMSEALLHDLGEGRLDVALVGVGPQVAVPEQRLLLHEEALALIVAPSHRFATRKRVALAELDDEPMAGLIAADLGVGIVPQTMATAMRGVVTVALKERFGFLTYAVWRPDPTPAARAFMALLRAQAARRAPSARAPR